MVEAPEQTKAESQNIEMNSGEVYDDGLDLDIALDEKTPETENIGQGANVEEGWKDKGIYKKSLKIILMNWIWNQRIWT